MDDAAKLPHKYGRIDKDYAMALATRPPEDDGPIYMVNLMKYHEVAQYSDDAGIEKPITGREADDRYNPASILAKIGATIVFVGDVVNNHVGSEDWQSIPDNVIAFSSMINAQVTVVQGAGHGLPKMYVAGLLDRWLVE